MLAVQVSDLKNKLSKYLRRVRAGERIVVMDKDEAVAELIPASEPKDVWKKLEREGWLERPTRAWPKRPLPPVRPVPIQEILADVRNESR